MIFAALKIHCSLACKQLLDRLGGYILEERGAISIKGKGDMVTYWLVGEEESRRVQNVRPKSSLRNSKRWKQQQHFDNGDMMASSLDSPKRLRFADSVEGEQHRQVEILTDSSTLTTKRNSCPNLKVGGMLQPNSFNHPVVVERKVKSFYRHQPHRKTPSSTTSLVDALIFSSLKTAPNGRPPTPAASSKSGPTPKIALSPPDESAPFSDCWPLLDKNNYHVNHRENDRETSV